MEAIDGMNEVETTSLFQPASVVPTEVPLGISGDSSLSVAPPPSEGIWAAITKPFFSQPEPNYMFALLRLEADLTETLKDEGKHLEVEIKANLKRLEVFNREKLEMLKNHHEAIKAQNYWGAWKAIAEYMTYASSIALGAACFTSGVGVAPAVFLIASGVIGIVNRAGADSGAWRWAASYITESQQLQIKYAQNFDTAMTTTAIATSILATCGAYHANLYARLAETSIETIFNTAANGMKIGQELGVAYHTHRSQNIQATLKQFLEKSILLQSEITLGTAEIQKMFKISEEIDRVIKIAIATQKQGQ